MFAGPPVKKIQRDQHNRLLNERGENGSLVQQALSQLNSEEQGSKGHISTRQAKRLFCKMEVAWSMVVDTSVMYNCSVVGR